MFQANRLASIKEKGDPRTIHKPIRESIRAKGADLSRETAPLQGYQRAFNRSFLSIPRTSSSSHLGKIETYIEKKVVHLFGIHRE